MPMLKSYSGILWTPTLRAYLVRLPRLGVKQEKLKVIPGTVPNPTEFPPGCKSARDVRMSWISAGKSSQNSLKLRQAILVHAICYPGQDVHEMKTD